MEHNLKYRPRSSKPPPYLNGLRICRKCQSYLLNCEFHKNKCGVQGLHSWCKKCDKEYRDSHADAIHLKARIRYGQNKELYAAKSLVARNKDREKYRKRGREYYWNNKEKIAEYNFQYYAKNKSRINKRNRKYYSEHKNEATVKRHQYYQKNKFRYKTYVIKRRSIERERPQMFTEQEWVELCGKYNNQCVRCGGKAKLTIDHVVPLSHPFNGDSNIENIQPLCKSCNSSKGNTVADYRPSFSAQDRDCVDH